MLFLPPGQGFSIYSLAAVLPLLAAKQRPTDANDWMTSDAEVACPDPNCPHAAPHHAAPASAASATRRRRRCRCRRAERRCSASGSRPTTRSRGSSAAAGSWPAGMARVDAAAAVEDMVAFADAGHHHLRLRRHLHRRRGADRRLPRRATATLRGAEALARIKVHTKCVPDLDLLPRLDARRRRAGSSTARCGGSGPSGSTSCSSTGGTTASPAGSRRPQWLDELRRGGQDRPPRRHQFRHARMAAIVDAGVPLVSMQVQYSLLDRRPEKAMRAAAAARGRVAPLLRHRRRAASSATAGSGSASRRAAREPLAHQVQADHRRLRRLGPVPGAAGGAAPGRRPARQRHRHGGERGDARPAGGGGGDRRRAQPRAPRGEPRDRRPRARRRRPWRRSTRCWRRRGRSRATSMRSSATEAGATARS